jgi:hypothetical protein
MSELNLPGISPEYLEKAGLLQIDADLAFKVCGIQQSGVWIPYRNFSGEQIREGGIPFGRLRLDQPRGDQRYHQRSGSRPHAYLPPSIWGSDKNLGSPLIIVEGEKKALALSEEGMTAIGIGGFYNFREGGGLVEEIAETIHHIPEPIYIFLGDRDVVFNYQFSHAAWTFSQLVAPASVLASCVPVDAPGKGMDDCRGVLGAGFRKWLVDHLFAGVRIDLESNPGSVAMDLLRLQVPKFSKLNRTGLDEAKRDIPKLAAGLTAYPIEQEEVVEIAVDKLQIRRNLMNRMVKEARRKIVVKSISEEVGGDLTKVVDLGEQPGTWTRRVLEIIGPVTYLYGGNLCDFDDGKFEAYTAASVVPRVDSANCSRFVRPDSRGELVPTHLSEKDGRLILGSLRQHREVLQPVKTLVNVPALVWSPAGPQLVTGYSRQHEILAATGGIDLPDPKTAAGRLHELMQDFDFYSAGDAGRAIAFLLTPALMSGGFLNTGRSPFFMIEKDQKGAGAGTLIRMLAAVYAAKPCSITPEDPRAAKEDLSRHLMEGANLIYFDNIRGKVLTTLPFLESLLTEPEFTYRALYVHGTVDVTGRVIACTSNGALLSTDLADRTVKVTIRRRPDGYLFHAWPEGDFIDHIVANNLVYLACIYSLIRAWAVEGRPAGTRLSGFRFKQWERASAWIIEKFFDPLPLLDAEHQAAQRRMTDPDYDLLRSVFRVVIERGLTAAQTATDLARLAMEIKGIEGDEKAAALRLGRALSREFPRVDAFEFADEFRVVRSDVSTPDTNYEKMKKYQISPRHRRTPPPPPTPEEWARLTTPKIPPPISR